ncbi:hypothetical protein IAU60_006393 [Kwoniella sp. DSM 27419]
MGTESSSALDAAKQLMTAALAPNSTLQSRRAFQQHLIALHSSDSYESKAFFGTLVPKFFGEFEDLQDTTVDALLDLCEDEDEKVRIIGIKGLGPTGKADPRWVRGNAGVLLQLLACQPRELKHVRESLHTLLSVAPVDVFSVMSDDCRGSEEETGASRRNIIEYLYKGTADLRRDILESGNNTPAEDAFREGFMNVLDLVRGDEARMLLEMLVSLPTVSGGQASPAFKRRFLRALTRSIPPNSKPETTLALIRLFNTFIDKVSPVDSRYLVLFMVDHGAEVVRTGVTGREASAKGLLERLKRGVDGAIAGWSSNGEEEGMTFASAVSKFYRSVLPELVDACRTLSRNGTFANAGQTVEGVLYAVYRFVTATDRRPELVASSTARDLRDLARDAISQERRLRKGSPETKTWLNIVDMAEILADSRERIVRIIPSWEASNSRPPPTGPSHAGPSSQSRDLPERSGVPPGGPRGLPPRGAPSGPRSSAQASLSSSRPPYRLDERSPHPQAQPRSQGRAPPSGPRQDQSGRPAGRPEHDDALSRRRSRSPVRNVVEAASAKKSGHTSPMRPATPPRPLTPPLPDTPPAPQPSVDSVPIAASAASAVTNAAAPIGTQPAVQAINGHTANGLSIRSRPAPAFADIQASSSPVDRLGAMGPSQTPRSTSIKRAREDNVQGVASTGPASAEADRGSVTRPSLLSRLGARDASPANTPVSKRPKSDRHSPAVESSAPTPLQTRLSLKDRINGNGNSRVSSVIPATSPASAATALDVGSNSRHAARPAADAPAGPRAGLSILNRSQSVQAVPQLFIAGQSAQSRGLSIRSRAGQAAATFSPPIEAAPSQTATQSKPLSILRHASSASASASAAGVSVQPGPVAPPADAQSRAQPNGHVAERGQGEDEVVVRKGRGFRARTPDDILMVDAAAVSLQGRAQLQPLPQTSVQAQAQAQGGLAGRLGPGVGQAGRGRGLVRPFGMGGVRGQRGRR